ncbi:MFS transporter [Rothia terrae]|jgi:GPH family glycoside/pentoside/hexuronide:cation symporter|uniref:MFS transporter n=2 Tax=Rothia terrae TaxID=396015 RepID=A0A7H2BDY1_9MICC|nr:glycoside-pentoside-hexuronide (GPH):cation symporter [Rothia terrae]QNV37877.1 MFS transporter [Rothia terrae]
MNEKKYLRWYNVVGYGSGDVAGNVVYAFLASFVMIYLTDTVGLNPGIIGTLILASKIFDGISDLFFGAMIDKTNTRMGKARPWMLWGYFGCAAMIIAIFAIPTSMGQFAQYAWFFIAYTLLNGVFYTANNIAYSALTSLITKNGNERVQMGSIRFMFAFGTSLLIQSITVQGVQMFGGGAEGWRTIAIIYALIGLAVNTLSVFSVKELPKSVLEEETQAIPIIREKNNPVPEKYSLKESLTLLVSNKFYLLILAVFLLNQIFNTTLSMGIYFMTYILGDATLLGPFAWAINVPLIIGLLFTPMVVQKFNGMYKINVLGYVVAFIARALVIVAAYMGNIPLMLVFSGIASIGMSPLQGTINALIAEASEYTFLSKKKRIDGTMFSATSLGVKIGGGVGTALAGWLLSISGYVANAPEQSESAISMLYIMYLWIPAGINLIILFLLTRLKVEKANKELRDNPVIEYTMLDN